MTHPLRKLLSGGDNPALVLHDEATQEQVAGLVGDVRVEPLGGEIAGAPRRWSAVALVVADALSLRQAVSVLPVLGRTMAVGWWLLEADEPALIVPRPEWPPMSALNARTIRSAGALTVLRTQEPIGANVVLAEVARTLSPARSGRGGLVVATTSREPTHAPPADPGLIVVDTAVDAVDPAREVPPDVVLTAGGADDLPAHDVIGRAPAVVSEPDLLAGPLDEGLLNPTGFLQRPRLGLVSLNADDDQRIRLVGAGLDLRLRDGGVTPAIVSNLRDHVGVDVAWGDPAPAGQVRAVAALAMAGVPLVGDAPPRSAATSPGTRLGDHLAAALDHPADLSTPLAREEHSVRLRRAALLEHSTLAWRERLAAAAGVGFRRFPTISVVLCTMRPDQLGFALWQVDRQRGVDLELILVTHGFSADERFVQERSGRPVTILEAAPSLTLGEVLNLGVAAASGDLVQKMDDDDWYGPDFLADLQLARHYSGATIVGTRAEFIYLEGHDRTLRRPTGTELTAKAVSGGSILIGRRHLNEVGGFRWRHRAVDSALSADVRAGGGEVYQSHGLGYVLRRRPSGHTWSPPDEYWLDDSRINDQWEGFRPSQLLEHSDNDHTDPKENPA